MPREIDPKLLEKVRRLSARKTPAEIAEETGLAVATVYRWLANPPRTPAKTPGAASKPSKGKSEPPDEDEDDDGAIRGAPDDVAAFDRLIAKVEAKLAKAPPTRTGPLVKTLADLLVKRAKLRPPAPPTPEEQERQARPLADEVLESIEGAVRLAETELGLP